MSAVWTFFGRAYSAAILLGGLAFFGMLAYGAWWDWKQRRRDVKLVRSLARRHFPPERVDAEIQRLDLALWELEVGP